MSSPTNNKPPSNLRLAHLLSSLLLLAATAFTWPSCHATSGRSFVSPARLGREANQRLAAHYFNGGLALDYLSEQPPQQVASSEEDLFACMDPSRELWRNFSSVYGRKMADSAEELERMNLFANTLRRLIVFNRLVQNEVLNETNYRLKPEVGNYHFIAPVGPQNAPLWFADLNDCELGLIKYVMLDIMHLLEGGRYHEAYNKTVQNADLMPLLNVDSFEQLANILLLRLFDRFSGDASMNQLFRWPLYLRKLAAYAYNRQVAAGAHFERHLQLVKFAYPAYYKDLKYNLWALNRTADNWAMKEQFDRFGELLGRKYSGGRQEKNKRLFIFRQNWSLVKLLNERSSGWRNISLDDDDDLQQDPTRRGPASSGTPTSAKLTLNQETPTAETTGRTGTRLKHTQFSDLTDLELVAFMNNDFSILGNDLEANQSAQFIEDNFPVRRLDDYFRDELALELELRRIHLSLPLSPGDQANNQDATFGEPEVAGEVEVERAPEERRPSFALARQVVDELINDVGLPMGPNWVASSEQELFSLFQRMGQLESKSYLLAGSTRTGVQHSGAELADEQRRRFDEFKVNLGRFRAWHIKAGWNELSLEQNAHLFRLADLSWTEVKLVSFRLCCLTEKNRQVLAATNASLAYLGSLTATLCPGAPDEPSPAGAASNQQRRHEEAELASQTELYYLYCVHFGKHHSSGAEFERRFQLFAANVHLLRRLSCQRALTVFRALRSGQPEALSSLDSLDQRRLHTDDLNLDRFAYFAPPNLEAIDSRRAQLRQPPPSPSWFAQLFSPTSGSSTPTPTSRSAASRFGVSYRREPYYFSQLLQDRKRPAAGETEASYAERLAAEAQDNQLAADRYLANGANRVYKLLADRYAHCRRTVNSNQQQVQQQHHQCLANGPYGDKAANYWTYGQSERLVEPAMMRVGAPDTCHLYWRGLDYWAADLVSQDELMPHLIRTATCHRPPSTLAGL